MNERETERRLRDWLDAQAPSAVPDGLRRAVAAVPTTVPAGWLDRLAAALGPRPAAIPRLAWLLLLAAGLLAAMIGGALLVGSQMQRRLPAVVPPVGQVFECPPGSTPDKPGPVDQARPAGPFDQHPAEMAFDRRAGRLVTLMGAEMWTFDVCTNTWTRMHPVRQPPSLSTFGTLVYDVDSDVTVALDDANTMWAYDLGADTWTVKGFAPVADSPLGLRFYDPVSGLVVAVGDDGDEDTLGLPLWGYEVETDTWTPIPQAKPLNIGPHYEDFAYDPSVDRLVAYSVIWEHSGNGDWLSQPRTWLFDIRTGTWSGASAVTPQFSYGMWGIQPGIAYDEAAGRTVMLGQGHSAAYDATADRWETLYVGAPWDEPGACGSRPECRTMPTLVYDPVNERLVVYGGSVAASEESGRVSPDDVLAFDTRTREWIVLLEASQPVAPP